MNDTIDTLNVARDAFLNAAITFKKDLASYLILPLNTARFNTIELVLRANQWTEIYDEVNRITGSVSLMAFPIQIKGWSAVKGVMIAGVISGSKKMTCTREVHLLKGKLKRIDPGKEEVFEEGINPFYIIKPNEEFSYVVIEDIFFVCVYKPQLDGGYL